MRRWFPLTCSAMDWTDDIVKIRPQNAEVDVVTEMMKAIRSSGSYDEYALKCAIAGIELLLMREEFDSFRRLYG